MDQSSDILLRRIRDGDERAAEQVFARYVHRLTALARARLSAKLSRRLDPEDVVMSAWRSFFVGAGRGRFVLQHSGDLWRLLVGITLNKLRRQVDAHAASKRDVTREQHPDPDWSSVFVDRQPTVDEAVALSDELEQHLTRMTIADRRVLELRLQGYRISEIVESTGRSERTVRRTIERFRLQLAEQSAFGGAIEIPIQAETTPSGASVESAPLRRDEFELPATQSDSDYLLQGMIGQGGSGKVYRALRKNDEVPVAVKFLRRSFWHDPDVVVRFTREVATATRLSHPGIVATHGFGRTPAGGCFIVMDLIDGRDLATELRGGRCDPRRAVDWVRQACEPLIHAHGMGVIHCDLKPANLLLDRSGGIHVADFGLARVMRSESAFTLNVEGTAPFMAPEQVARLGGPIDERTDVYGIGAVLYSLLYGRPPYVGHPADVLSSVVSTAAPQFPDDLSIPNNVRRLCMTCLEKTMDSRFSSIEALASAIDAIAW